MSRQWSRPVPRASVPVLVCASSRKSPETPAVRMLRATAVT